MYHRNPKGWTKHADFILIDVICQQFVLAVVYAMHFDAWLYADQDYRFLALFLMFSDVFVFLSFNTLHNVLRRGYYVEFRETMKHCFFVAVMAMSAMYVMNSRENYSKSILYSTLFYHIFLGFGCRLLWKWIIQKYRNPVVRKRLVLAVLDPETAEATMEQINHNPAVNYRITGIILNGEDDRTVIDDVPVVASISEAARYIRRKSVDAVYVDCSSSDPNVAELMDACIQMAIPVHYHVPAIYGEGVKYFVEQIEGQTVLITTLNYATPRERIAKRALDIVGGLIGSVIAVLLMIIIGPMIKKASPGPILFAQERVGRNGRHFKMYKLRSMHVDADEKKQELMEQNQIPDGLMFKMENDPRVIGNEILPDGTCKKGIGDFIRRTSLDEFPQFFNVLMGQMSLVGTRPPTVDEMEKYEYHHRARLACKPGITGLWQVSGRSKITDFEEVVRLDMQYIMNWSFGLDIRILLKTIIVVFKRQGAL